MKNFLKNSFGALKQWISGLMSINGFINGGWFIAGILILLFGYKILGSIALGIFFEKNRYALVNIYKKIR